MAQFESVYSSDYKQITFIKKVETHSYFRVLVAQTGFTDGQSQYVCAPGIRVDDAGCATGAVGRLRKEINSSLRENYFNR